MRFYVYVEFSRHISSLFLSLKSFSRVAVSFICLFAFPAAERLVKNPRCPVSVLWVLVAFRCSLGFSGLL